MGSPFWVETNAWTLPPVTLYLGTNGTNVAYAHPTATAKTILELGQGTPRRLESEMAYDNFGNQTTNAAYGIVENNDRSAFDDERIVTIEYTLNTNAWILRHPARQEIKDEHGAVLSRSENYYDDETFSGLNFGSVSVGNSTLTRAWVNASNPTAYIKASRTKYDSYGNPVVLCDPLAAASGGAVDVAQGHVRELTYDPRFHCYPLTETVHVGNGNQDLAFGALYDEGFATTTSVTDCNSNSTTYAYDDLGRLLNVVKPYDSPLYPSTEYSYALAVPSGIGGVVNYVETRRRDKSGVLNPKSEMYYFSRQFVDGLGRKLMIKTEAEPAAGWQHLACSFQKLFVSTPASNQPML